LIRARLKSVPILAAIKPEKAGRAIVASTEVVEKEYGDLERGSTEKKMRK
jgi:hypothetical protein